QHSFFKTDVYYYSDNRSIPVDVYYHAITLKLLGYKPKHKNYVLYDKSDLYLKINRSIKNKLATIGYQTRYVDITDVFNKIESHVDSLEQSLPDVQTTYYDIMDNLIKNHIQFTRGAI